MQKYALLICFADYYSNGILFLSNEVLAYEPQTHSRKLEPKNRLLSPAKWSIYIH